MNDFRGFNVVAPVQRESVAAHPLFPPLNFLGRMALCLATLLTGFTVEAGALPSAVRRQAARLAAQALRPGDIVFTDSEAAVLKLDVVTGQTSPVAVGGALVRPCGLAIGPDQTIYVADTGSQAIVAIDPATGESTVLARSEALGVPFGIAVALDGELLVANAQAVLGINPADGTQRTVAAGGLLQA